MLDAVIGRVGAARLTPIHPQCPHSISFQTAHCTTEGLLAEERTRYERCRTSLEKSQEDLADVNERFDELRGEVEVSILHAGAW